MPSYIYLLTVGGDHCLDYLNIGSSPRCRNGSECVWICRGARRRDACNLKYTSQNIDCVDVLSAINQYVSRWSEVPQVRRLRALCQHPVVRDGTWDCSGTVLREWLPWGVIQKKKEREQDWKSSFRHTVLGYRRAIGRSLKRRSSIYSWRSHLRMLNIIIYLYL